MERSNRTLREALEETELTSRQQAEEVLGKIIAWYNTERLHSALGYVTRIGEKRFFNLVEPVKLELGKGIRAEWKPEEFRSYVLYKVEISGDELVVHSMDMDAARRIVHEGKLTGSIEEDKEGKVHGVTLEATSQQLRTFLATPESDALFSGKPVRLKKVK